MDNKAKFGDIAGQRKAAETVQSVISNQLFESMLHVCDFGCGDGSITDWWVQQAPRNEKNPNANYTKVSGIDLIDRKTDKFDFKCGDILKMPYDDDSFNIGWCHYTLQQLKDPIQGLLEMRRVLTPYSLLFLTVPQTLDTEYGRLKTKFNQYDRTFYNLPTLITHLAMTGWNCNKGYFLKPFNDRNIHAIIKPIQDWEEIDNPMDLNHAALVERGALPECTHDMIKAHGYFDETCLLLPWMNGSLTNYGDRV